MIFLVKQIFKIRFIQSIYKSIQGRQQGGGGKWYPSPINSIWFSPIFACQLMQKSALYIDDNNTPTPLW